MRRNLAVLTLLILVGLCACDTRELSPSTSPTPGVARALSPAPTSMATLTATLTPRPTVTPTREPTMTPWPTHTASPTRTSTPTPTPLGTENVTLVGRMEDPAHVACVQGDRAYVGAGADLVVLDVSDPAQPRSVGQVTLPYTVLDVCVADNRAYVAAGPQGLHVVDMTDPAHPTSVGVYDDLSCAYAVAVSGRYVYVAAGPDGLHVVDVTDPTAPTQIGTHAMPGAWTHHVAVSGDLAYMAGYDYATDRVRWQVVDVSNPTTPAVLGTHDLPGWAWGAAVAGERVYIADGRRGGLRTLDVSNRTAPAELGFYHTWDRRVYDVAVEGTTAYVAAGPEGLRVLDVSDPAAVVEVGHYDTPGDAVGVAAFDGLVYVADGAGGLEILRVATSPARPTPSVTPVPTPTATPRIVSISPDEIEARVERDRAMAISDILQELGVAGCGGALEMIRYDVELDGKEGQDVLFKLVRPHWSHCYLFFTRDELGWRYLGNVNTFSKYGPRPGHRIVTIGKQGVWFVVQNYVHSGTGLLGFVEEWFKIGGAKPRMVLWYPVEGHLVGWPGPHDIDYKAEVASTSWTDDRCLVDIQYTVSYTLPAGICRDMGFGPIVRRERCIWDSAAQRFVFDPAGSDLSFFEIDTIGGFFHTGPGSETITYPETTELANEEFLRRNFEEWTRLALEKESLWRICLAQLLNGRVEHFGTIEFADIPEKRALLAIVDSIP